MGQIAMEYFNLGVIRDDLNAYHKKHYLKSVKVKCRLSITYDVFIDYKTLFVLQNCRTIVWLSGHFQLSLIGDKSCKCSIN